MSTAWISYKLPEFARDFLRDFCLSSESLEKEFRFVDDGGHAHFEAIKSLMGVPMSKGMLWRLHDTSLYFFRNDAKDCPIGALLDWCIGYLVHETRKLQESAYQIDKCTPAFINFKTGNVSSAVRERLDGLEVLIEKSRESMRQETAIIRFIMRKCRTMIPLYFQSHRHNTLVARFLVERNDLVRRVFRFDYQALIDGIYGADRNDLMYVLAASSLRAGGWFEEAHRCLEQAAGLNEDSEELRRERELLSGSSWNEEMYLRC